MEQPAKFEKGTTYFVKTGILVVLLFVESLLLTIQTLNYIKSIDYFTPALTVLLTIAGLMLAIIYTYSLTIGAWDRWEQFVIVPVPIAFGIFVTLSVINPFYAVVASAVVLAWLSYEVLITTRIKAMLIKFNPKLILRLSARGLLLSFSGIAALMVFVNASNPNFEFDLGGILGKAANEYVQKIVSPKVPKDTDGTTINEELGEKAIPIDPEVFGQLGGLRMDSNSTLGNLGFLNLDITETVTESVNSAISQYSHFVPPLLALIVFGIFQFLGFLTNIVFLLTVDILFAFAKKAGFFKIQTQTVEQEYLRF
jgi:hypothetical protein